MKVSRLYLALTVLLAPLTACSDDEPTAPVAVVPSAPTAVVASIGDALVSLAFAPPASDGGSPVTTYIATCAGGGATFTGSASASPVVVSGLTNGTEYSCAVAAGNIVGMSAASASVTATPAAAQ
jgi:Fibronectin type III domain